MNAKQFTKNQFVVGFGNMTANEKLTLDEVVKELIDKRRKLLMSLW